MKEGRSSSDPGRRDREQCDTDQSGRDLWNIVLGGSPEWKDLPALPPVEFPPGNSYYVFFHAQDAGGTGFALRDLQLRGEPIIVLPGSRRFGAVGW